MYATGGSDRSWGFQSKLLRCVNVHRCQSYQGFLQTPIFHCLKEELHLNLIMRIALMSHKKHKYILIIVDAYSCFVAAIPSFTQADTLKAHTHAINVESKRLGYHPSILHLDCGTEFVNSELEKLLGFG